MNNKPYIALVISIISVSFAAIFIVSCDPKTHPLSIALYRLLFTTLLILPFVIFRQKTRNELVKIPLKTLLIMCAIGVILALHFAFWITSLQLTSVASSVILVTAHPVIVAPISYYLLKERLSLLNILGIILSVFGVIVLVYGKTALSFFIALKGDILATDSIEGNILAMLGGVAAGLYILGGRKIRKKVTITNYALVVYTIATITILIICLFFNAPIYNLNPKDYQLIFLMAITAGIFGHTLYNWSLEYIRASLASVMLLGEPIGSSILAFALPWIHQVPSNFTIIGGCIILIGIFFTSKNPEKTNP